MPKTLIRYRYDLSIALLNGSRPVFYNQPQEPVIPYPALSTIENNMYPPEITWLIQQLDGDLVTACQNMRRFCFLTDLGTQAQQIITPEIIHETMTSVMYRLLHMRFAAGVIDEAVHLSVLVFSYHLFIQWRDIKLPYEHLPKIYYDCIQRFRIGNNVSPRLMLWLLMTGAISLFNVSNESWLRELLQEYIGRCQVKTWNELQEVLKSFMWISLLDAQMGMQIYDELHLSVREEEL
jgi:hypothetical protein